MIKFFIIILSLLFCLPSFALEEIDYQNIKDGAKISFDETAWTTKVKRKTTDYYVKKISDGTSNFSEFYSPQGNFVFSTGTQYEFVHKGSLIGYSNNDLKFYEFDIKNNILEQRELTEEEIQALFPKHKIIKISQFSKSTNSLKIKKKRGDLKLILLNDSDRYFYNYMFTTNNAKFEQYNLKGFLNITKKGMIQFSSKINTDAPWFILLVR